MTTKQEFEFEFDCPMADFHACGEYRVFDESRSKSSVIKNGEVAFNSVFSLGWLKAVGDFKLNPRNSTEKAG
jgi:hypothetical protein